MTVDPRADQPRVDMLRWLARALSKSLALAVLIVGGYYVFWLAGGRPYDATATAVLGGCLILVVVANLVARVAQLDRAVMLRLVLGVVGLTLALSGLLIVAGASPFGVRAGDPVAVAVVLGGAFVLYCARFLPADFDSSMAVPRHVDTGMRSSSDAREAVLRRYRDFGGGTERLVSICLGELAIADLHYVAYYVDNRCRFSVDLLGNDELSRFADRDVSPDERRTQYLRHGPHIHRLVARLNRQFDTIEGGRLLRVVLDVERGALYYYYVDDDTFLVGVTLDQQQVHLTDRKMVTLVTKIRRTMGLRSIEELEL